nr:ATP-binding protein [Kibdelosporangium sp. MJ126-NF4]CEL21197.1 putative two-component system sensor kinase [Kibdelosporangium sp. MJ126-NF4]CTQ96237.1 putative two-component system sensor kinase [Kibdelosporangium sp. MJ126-NF4]
MLGAVEANLRRMSRGIMAALRTAVLVGVTVVAVLRTGPELWWVAVIAVAWSALLGVALFLGFSGSSWIVPVDSAFVVALCLAQPWLVAADDLATSTNWVLAVVSATAVAHQWYVGVGAAAASVTALVAAYLVGVYLATPDNWAAAVPIALWTYGEATASRVMFVLLRSGARAVDRTAAQLEHTRQEAAVAVARRAEERHHLAALHDTAASTMLAAGLGMVDGDEPWLAEQAARDIRVLTEQPEEPVGVLDLVDVLADITRFSPLAVVVTGPESLPVPAGPALEIGGCVREALTNVVRHSGVDAAEIVVESSPVSVRVVDHGAGFDPASVSVHRRGISGSIVERMRRAGGTAVVQSRPGSGTTVRLVWPHDE